MGALQVVFLTDNGGTKNPYKKAGVPANNAPLVGGKGGFYEGGLRVPFAIQWKGSPRVPLGAKYTNMVCAENLSPFFVVQNHNNACCLQG
jgi:arylsulfatase A-like enzyme